MLIVYFVLSLLSGSYLYIPFLCSFIYAICVLVLCFYLRMLIVLPSGIINK